MFQTFAYGSLARVDYKSPPKERNCNQRPPGHRKQNEQEVDDKQKADEKCRINHKVAFHH